MSAAGQIRVATTTAGVVIAFQVLAKATRDTVFLTTFPAQALPWMVGAAAVLAIIAAFLLTFLMSEMGAKNATILLFLVSAALLVLEWLAKSTFPRATAVGIFVHLSVLTVLLISGFWSILNECFDPHTAKKAMSKVAAGATAGGLLGGLIAERSAAWLTPGSNLLLVAAGHVAAAMFCTRLEASPTSIQRRARSSGPGALFKDPYLRNLAAVVVLATTAAGILDYLFKAEAAATLDTPQLMTCFGFFYTGVGIVTFLTQIFIGPRALKFLGVVRSTLPLPAVTLVSAAMIAMFPGLATALVGRGAEAVVRSSLFRSGYELLFSPLAPLVRRRTKPLIDVGADRLGDVAGGLVVGTLLIVLSERYQVVALAIVAGLLSLGVLVLLKSLQRQYLRTLEGALMDHGERRTATVQESLLFRTMARFSPTALFEHDAIVDEAPEPVPEPALSEENLIEELSRNHLSETRTEQLGALAKSKPSLFVDVLLDSQAPFAARRRVPRLLLNGTTKEVSDALVAGLSDRRFEVRFHCGSALFLRHRRGLDPAASPEVVWEAVHKEVQVDRRLWSARQLLETNEDAQNDLASGLISSRVDRSLEHIFHLIAPLHSEEPLRIAFRALHTDDATLRGTALEYLEMILPMEIRESLWPLIGETTPPTGDKPSAGALASLLESHASIELHLKALATLE